MTPTGDAEIILVGNELLKGERSDAHLAWLGSSLARYGLRVDEARVVRDGEEVIAAAVSACLGRARVVIVAGGLGPTPDDVTREGVARGVGLPLEFDEASWKHITGFFAARGRVPTENNRRQAQFPAGATVLENTRGTAPGFLVGVRGTTVISLPGPPRELQRMFESEVAPRLAAASDRPPLRVETFRTFGVGESKLMELFGDLLDGLDAFDVSSLPWITGVDIILTARRDATAAAMDDEATAVKSAFTAELGTKLFEHGQRSLAQVLGELLQARGETLSIAESLTGGMMSMVLTDIAGSSRYLLADVVTYSDASKSAFAGVDASVIARDGAVSETVCEQMARGVRERTGATWALATTGIAGPGGGTDKKPVGLTYLGLAGDDGCDVVERVFPGERDDVRRKTTFGALWMLYDRLMREDD